MIISPDFASSLEVTVGGTSTTFAANMPTGSYWTITSTTGAWIKQGAGTPVASAGAGSVYLPPNVPVVIDARRGSNVAMIQDTTAGKASLCRAVM